MSPSWSVRVARAAVFAVVCVGVSAAGHAWMSGSSVPPSGLLAGGAAVFAVALLLAGGERRWPAIAGALMAGETGLHLLFAATSSSAMGTGMPGPAMPPMTAMPTGTAVGAQLHGTAGMVAAHAAAALLCGWWLRIGERALFELLRLLTSTVVARLRRLTAAAGAALPPPALRRVTVPVVDVRPVRSPLLHSVVRRGPPPVTV